MHHVIKGRVIFMEWNFLFRIDHLHEKGEERILKGLVYTEKEAFPKLDQIKKFLHGCGYKVEIEDPEQLIFLDPNPLDPIEIKIVEIGHNEKNQADLELKMLAEQFMKRDPIGL